MKTRPLDLSPREHLAADDPLSSESSLALAELKGRDFLGIDESEMPGRNQKDFSPRRAASIFFVAKRVDFHPKEQKDFSLQGFSTVSQATDRRIRRWSAPVCCPGSLRNPHSRCYRTYFLGDSHPGVVFRKIDDPAARWDLLLLRKKGNMTPATSALLEAWQISAARLG